MTSSDTEGSSAVARVSITVEYHVGAVEVWTSEDVRVCTMAQHAELRDGAVRTSSADITMKLGPDLVILPGRSNTSRSEA